MHSGISLSSASHQLRRLEDREFISKLSRGFWANVKHPHFSAYGTTPYLLGAEQGYISFLTALHYHEMISQIPKAIQLASTGHARVLYTKIGNYEFFQLKPELMIKGVAWSDVACPYRMALPEKALFDTLYLATRKGNRFASLPELELPKQFDKKLFFKFCHSTAVMPTIQSAIISRASKYFVR